MLRINRTYAVAAHDVAMAAISFVLALILRWGPGEFLQESLNFLAQGIVAFTLVCAIVFWRTRIYRGFWRYTSLRDVINIGSAVTLAMLIFLPILFAVTRLEAFPRSAIFINWFVLIALLLGPRLLYRAFVEGSLRGITQRTSNGDRIPVILVGAGDDAELFMRSTAGGGAANYRVVGLIDDDPAKIGRHIHGVRIFGPASDVAAITRDLRLRGMQPRRLILTSDAFDPEWVNNLLTAAGSLGMPMSRLPRLTDFRSGEAREIEVKPVAIEDLLGRPQAALDLAAMKSLVNGKRVAITGAGGTIGSELCRQIAPFEPASLTLIDNAEYNLYAIDQELADTYAAVPRGPYLGDVRDRGRIDSAFAKERPEVVFHAAALKHVPMVEANPNEGVLTNVIGTRNVADACVAFDVATMVLISTDKAVNPTSIMGATKRIAESYCQALGVAQAAGGGGTRLVTVRFGNVLGSSGSVVPLFQKQIAAGGPVTVTDPGVTRYFMTTREAVQLVLQASARDAEQSGSEIYVLDMGEPVRIEDLARQMIRLAGRIPDEDIEITFTGLRPGEKMFEELFHGQEPPTATGTPGVLRAASRAADLARIGAQIDDMEATSRARLTEETLAQIKTVVPEYQAPAPATNNMASGSDVPAG